MQSKIADQVAVSTINVQYSAVRFSSSKTGTYFFPAASHTPACNISIVLFTAPAAVNIHKPQAICIT